MSQSVTAPRVSLEELESERAALSEQEAYEVACRAKGWHAIHRETSTMVKGAIEAMVQSLDRVDANDDYVRAMQLCPKVVLDETPYLFFLRCCRFDPLAAARRLAMYWQFRREVFEEEASLAFSPMLQTGGALSDEDALFLRKGAIRVLGKDRCGRSVMFIRHAGIKLKDFKRSLRCLLYLSAVICKDSTDQRHGIVVIVETQNMAPEDYNRRLMRMFVRHLQFSCPLQVHCVHILFHTERGFGAWIVPVILGMTPPALRKLTFAHVEIRPEGFVTALAPFGLSESLLPIDNGGSLEKNNFQLFLNKALRKEGESSIQVLPCGTPRRKTDE